MSSQTQNNPADKSIFCKCIYVYFIYLFAVLIIRDKTLIFSYPGFTETEKCQIAKNCYWLISQLTGENYEWCNGELKGVGGVWEERGGFHTTNS